MPTAIVAEDEPILRQQLEAKLAKLWPELEIIASVEDGAAARDAETREAPFFGFHRIAKSPSTPSSARPASSRLWLSSCPLPGTTRLFQNSSRISGMRPMASVRRTSPTTAPTASVPVR